jgi:pimeloyl-ACP methyl ester carboxylesterase
MRRLGYDRWITQGGDWGAMVSDTLGAMAPPGCIGMHLNMPIIFPTPEDAANATPAEAAAIATWTDYLSSGSGYQQQQSTRPQTLAYALTDSPVGQAAWILEKFGAWSDNDGDPRSAIALDAMLDNVTLYWLQGSAGSSARLYWDTAQSNGLPIAPVAIPTGISIFPKELFRPSRRWAKRRFTNIVYWHELDRGGHFAAFEQPELFVGELRAFARTLR